MLKRCVIGTFVVAAGVVSFSEFPVNGCEEDVEAGEFVVLFVIVGGGGGGIVLWLVGIFVRICTTECCCGCCCCWWWWLIIPEDDTTIGPELILLVPIEIDDVWLRWYGLDDVSFTCVCIVCGPTEAARWCAIIWLDMLDGACEEDVEIICGEMYHFVGSFKK